MIKFILKEEEAERFNLGQVEINQFFVNHVGYLCQKVTDHSYNYVAEPCGKPYADYKKCNIYEDVKRIIPLTEKIEF